MWSGRLNVRATLGAPVVLSVVIEACSVFGSARALAVLDGIGVPADQLVEMRASLTVRLGLPPLSASAPVAVSGVDEPVAPKSSVVAGVRAVPVKVSGGAVAVAVAVAETGE